MLMVDLALFVSGNHEEPDIFSTYSLCMDIVNGRGHGTFHVVCSLFKENVGRGKYFSFVTKVESLIGFNWV